MINRLLRGGASILATVSFAVPAMAQDMAPTVPDEQARGVEDIVVTAQRRAESLQDVPVAVTALTAEGVVDLGVVDTTTLTNAVPALNFQKTANGGVPFIRGVGNGNVAVGDESAVAVYVDGVYMPSIVGTLFSLSNIDQIEVLKGPQGTLFGRNATGGVIQITTRKPSYDPVMEASFGYANYDTVESKAYLSGGLGSQVALDLALYYRDQGKGWGYNTTLDRDVFKSRDFSARSKLVWEPSDATRITLAGDYNDSKDDVYYSLLPGSTGLDGVSTNMGFRTVQSTYPVEVSTEQGGASLTVESDFDWASLVSISSYRELSAFFTPDNDALGFGILNAELTQSGKSYAQELRLLSDLGSPVKWIVGGYFLHSTGGYHPIYLTGLAIAPADFVSIDSEQRTISYSAFGQVTVPITDSLNVTGGLRYTVDEQRIQYTQGSNFGAASGQAKARFSKLTPRISLDYRFSPDFMVYASYNKGFKSGLFNTVTPTDPPVRPATVDAYEVGFKSELFDGIVRLNGAAFYYDQKDLQLLQVQGALTIVVNAAESRVKGADFDVEVALTPQLTLRGGASFLDGEYTNYGDAPITTPNPLGGNIIVSGDARGLDTLRSPKFQSVLGVTWEPTGNLSFAANYNYNDSFAWDPDNRLRQPSYHMLNGSVGWKSDDERFGVRLWARNILGEKFYTFATASAFGDIGKPAEPATYGFTITVKN